MKIPKHSSTTRLTAISPVDGRYREFDSKLPSYFSESALIKNRVRTELKWIERLSQTPKITAVPTLNLQTAEIIRKIAKDFNLNDAERVKEIENETRHDVKAVEYFIREKFQKYPLLERYQQHIHLFCTSEDITNVAYSLAFKKSKKLLEEKIIGIIERLTELSQDFKSVVMVARTHGQIASPTTMGKELSVFIYRLMRQFKTLKRIGIYAKFNGAVGNFNAHFFAYPEVEWQALAKRFIVEDMGLEFNPLTTQIESHDNLAELFDSLKRINVILISFCRDIWGYCSRGYFNQKMVAKEVGSSTMPHKINPIDFENSEGNLGIANCQLSHFSSKLPISRFQRDLSDSTVLRNIGTSFAHCLLAYESLHKGLSRLKINQTVLSEELSNCWSLLAEPIQTILRLEGVEDSYEKLKELTRGKNIGEKEIREFIRESEISKENKEKLLNLRPEGYVGLAEQLVEKVKQYEE